MTRYDGFARPQLCDLDHVSTYMDDVEHLTDSFDSDEPKVPNSAHLTTVQKRRSISRVICVGISNTEININESWGLIRINPINSRIG